MEKSNKVLIFDTDVIINVLAQETETISGKPLWAAPLKLLEQVEQGRVRGLISITTLLEIRYLMRRKKEYSEDEIKSYVNKLLTLLEIIVPDEIALLKANELQTSESLDPFDAILLAVAISVESSRLISRDKSFLRISSKYISTSTPEKILSPSNNFRQ